MVSSFKTLTLRGIPFSSSSLFKFRGFCGLPTSVCVSNRYTLTQVLPQNAHLNEERKKSRGAPTADPTLHRSKNKEQQLQGQQLCFR